MSERRSEHRLAAIGSLCLLGLGIAVAVSCGGAAPQPPPPAPPPSETTTAPAERAPAEAHQDAVGRASLVVLEFRLRGAGGTEAGRALTERLTTTIGTTRKFRLVERDQLADLMKEYDLTRQGFTDKAFAVRSGQLIGADYLLMGNIVERGASSSVKPVPYTSHVTRVTSARVAARVRVVDTRTGEVVAQWPVQASASREQTADGSSLGPAEEGATLAAVDDELARKIALEIVDQVYPIKVAAVNGDRIVLNRGDGGGLRVEDQIDLFRPGAPIVDPDTGEKIGTDEQRIGSARVTSVQAKSTEAAVTSGAGGIQVGMIARAVTRGRAATPAEVQGREAQKDRW